MDKSSALEYINQMFSTVADPTGEEKPVKECRCMNCGWKENCKAVADHYIECKFMIILIDLILHKTKAYWDLLFNMLNVDAGDTKGVMWKSTLIYFLLDAYERGSSRSLFESIWTCGKESDFADPFQVLVDVLLGNFIFISAKVLGTKSLLNVSFDITRCKEIVLAILLSSYFKLYLIAMMVWEFPSSVLFIIDVFVLSSNAVALKVVTQLQTSGCLGVCFGAHAAKLLADRWLLHLLSGA